MPLSLVSLDLSLNLEDLGVDGRGSNSIVGLCLTAGIILLSLSALQLGRTIGPLYLLFAQFSPAFSRISPWRSPKNFRRQYPPCSTSGCVSSGKPFWRKSTDTNLHVFLALGPTHLKLHISLLLNI